jgi:PAS domain S-box-containing protein
MHGPAVLEPSALRVVADPRLTGDLAPPSPAPEPLARAAAWTLALAVLDLGLATRFSPHAALVPLLLIVGSWAHRAGRRAGLASAATAAVALVAVRLLAEPGAALLSLALEVAALPLMAWVASGSSARDDAERALRHAATDVLRKWELVFRHSSWGILVLGDDGATIVSANPAFERMHGGAAGSMTGRTLAYVVAPAAQESHAQQLVRLARDGRSVYESIHRRLDGSQFPVLVDITEVRDGTSAPYRIANYLDLSVSRAAEEARETAELRFRAVQDASPDAFTLWDIVPGGLGIREGYLRYANPAANRLLGVELRDSLGRTMTELFPELRGSMQFTMYEEVFRTGRTSEITTFHEHLDAWLRIVCVKIQDGIGIIATDVTAAKQAEAVLRRTRDELEHLVTERTIELHRARDLAVLANRAKSDFLSRASHELRTPLSSVIGFSNILLKNKQGSLAPDELTYLSRIARNGRNLLALVNDLLDLSKIEAGRVDLELSPVSLFDVLHEVQDTLESRAAELGLTLSVHVAQEDDFIIADETRLRQVLVNLTGNAIKYTREGAVNVRVVGNAAGAPSRIDVIDTGPGIAPDRLDAIFQPFIVDATPAAGDAATGLGLAITRALCDLLGYRLTVDSRLGEGSTFSVHLLAPEGIASPVIRVGEERHAAV